MYISIICKTYTNLYNLITNLILINCTNSVNTLSNSINNNSYALPRQYIERNRKIILYRRNVDNKLLEQGLNDDFLTI